MNNLRKISKFVVVIPCLVTLGIGFFMPFYEGYTCPTCIEDSGVGRIEKYYATDVGLISVYNGFGSAFAQFNLNLMIVLTIGIFIPKKIKSIPIVISVCFLLALLLLGLGNSAGFGAPICDRMLQGYDASLIASLILIIYSFYDAFVKETKPE